VRANGDFDIDAAVASMSSYVAVLGKPTGETSCVFGLTPQEIRYLQVPNAINAILPPSPSFLLILNFFLIPKFPPPPPPPLLTFLPPQLK